MYNIRARLIDYVGIETATYVAFCISMATVRCFLQCIVDGANSSVTSDNKHFAFYCDNNGKPVPYKTTRVKYVNMEDRCTIIYEPWRV